MSEAGPKAGSSIFDHKTDIPSDATPHFELLCYCVMIYLSGEFAIAVSKGVGMMLHEGMGRNARKGGRYGGRGVLQKATNYLYLGRY